MGGKEEKSITFLRGPKRGRTHRGQCREYHHTSPSGGEMPLPKNSKQMKRDSTKEDGKRESCPMK